MTSPVYAWTGRYADSMDPWAVLPRAIRASVTNPVNVIAGIRREMLEIGRVIADVSAGVRSPGDGSTGRGNRMLRVAGAVDEAVDGTADVPVRTHRIEPASVALVRSISHGFGSIACRFRHTLLQCLSISLSL